MNYSYDRRATVDHSTPAATAKILEHALASHFSGHFLQVDAGRGVGVKAARMDPEAFAKEQITKGYEVSGINPIANILIVPDSGNAWTSVSVKSGAGMGDSDAVLKEVGVTPIRRASKLTPEKAASMVIEWFTKNAAKLKSGAVTGKQAYDYDRRAAGVTPG